MFKRSKSRVPGWFVALVVLVTAGVTAFAMLRKQTGQGWPSATALMPMRVTKVVSPGAAALDPRQFQRVASTHPVPVIQAGAAPKHGERGACTLCHTVVDAVGSVIPIIQAMASLPHQYRGGICINCHKVKPSSGAPASPTGGAAPVAATGIPLALPAPPARQPSEAAWLGLEVVPITRLTASQYGIPSHIQGLVVAEAEGQAAASGLTAGDVIVAINGLPVTDMNTFIRSTDNGRQPAGTVTILRGGKFMSASLGSVPQPQAQAQAPMTARAPITPQAPMAGQAAQAAGRQYPCPVPGLGLGRGAGAGAGAGGGGGGVGFGQAGAQFRGQF